MATTPRKRFSMIREFQMADWFTLANAVCGTGAIFAVISFLETAAIHYIYLACSLVLAALIFDVLDGRIARWRREASLMGQELDSLSDVISFGVAPAVIAYGCGMQGEIDRIVLLFFVACGVSRLARYNVTAASMSGESGKVTHFEGTPIPTSIVLVGVLALATASDSIRENLWLGEVFVGRYTLHPLVALFAISGSLMISRIRIPKI